MTFVRVARAPLVVSNPSLLGLSLSISFAGIE